MIQALYTPVVVNLNIDSEKKQHLQKVSLNGKENIMTGQTSSAAADQTFIILPLSHNTNTFPKFLSCWSTDAILSSSDPVSASAG